MSISIRYLVSERFACGIETSFQRSDFDYSVNMRVVPAGNPAGEVNDTLKVRTVNAGIRLSYLF